MMNTLLFGMSFVVLLEQSDMVRNFTPDVAGLFMVQ